MMQHRDLDITPVNVLMTLTVFLLIFINSRPQCLIICGGLFENSIRHYCFSILLRAVFSPMGTPIATGWAPTFI